MDSSGSLLSTKLSIVAPVFNERRLIGEFLDRCVVAARATELPFEVVLVDDCSVDHTVDRVLEKMREYPGLLRLVQLSRNFGQQAALHAGLTHATGDVLVTLDSDLQDPPELIPSLVAKLEDGPDIVYARRVGESGGSWLASGHTGIKAVGAFLFHKGMSTLRLPVPRDVGEFRCMRRRVVDHLLAFPEHMLFLPGLVAYAGFEVAFVPYARQRRRDGASARVSHLAGRALDALTSFSIAPLNAILVMSAVAWIVPLLVAGWMTVEVMRGGATVGTFVVVVSIATAWCLTLSVLGILAHYVGRVFIEVKQRPRYFIQRIVDDPHRGD